MNRKNMLMMLFFVILTALRAQAAPWETLAASAGTMAAGPANAFITLSYNSQSLQLESPRLDFLDQQTAPETTLKDLWNLKSLLATPPNKEDLAAPSISLVRKALPSNYYYASWINLHTGYGEIFPDSPFTRSHLNGPKIDEQRVLYFKMSFRF